MQLAGNIGSSVAYLDAAYRYFSEAGPVDRWRKYRYIANYYLNNDIETDKARIYTDSMMLVLKGRERQYKEAYAHTLFTRGDVLMSEKKYQDAFNLYYDGHSYAQKNLDICEQAAFTGQLAMIQYWQIHFREAIPYFRKALDENAHCRKKDDFENNFVLPQRWLNHLALCYEMWGKTDSALFYLEKALVLMHGQEAFFPENKIAIEMARGTLAGNLGDVYLALEQYDSSRYYLEECIRIHERPGYNEVAANLSKILMDFIDLRLNRPLSIPDILNRSEDSLKAVKGHETDRSILMQCWYQLKDAYYRDAHRIDSSLFYQQKLQHYVDSTRMALRDFRQTNMESTFAIRAQQYQLSLLGRDNQVKKSSLLITIVSGSIALVILLIVWRNLKRSRENITELTRLNSQVAEQNIQMRCTLGSLEQSQVDNTRMIKTIAHDLRNPIGAIKMAATLISMESVSQPEDKKILDIISRSAESSLQMVDDLLCIPAKSEEIRKEPVDLAAVLQYSVDQLKHKATAKQQYIELNTLPVILPADGEKLWRVISNLVANAIKFSPDGTVIHVDMEKEDQWVRIAVRDNGIGIPEEMKNKIFDMFTEARRPGTAGEKPFGIGLAISKQIVKAHGGNIWFESKVGNGTTFWVELPGSEGV